MAGYSKKIYGEIMRQLIRNIIAFLQSFLPVWQIKFTHKGKEHISMDKFFSLRKAKIELKSKYYLFENAKIERFV